MTTLYCITNLIENKKYVGVTSQDIHKRWRQHTIPSNTKDLGRDIQRLGVSNFKFEILAELPENLSDSKIRVIELEWIYKLECNHPKGYNKYLGSKLYFNC